MTRLTRTEKQVQPHDYSLQLHDFQAHIFFFLPNPLPTLRRAYTCLLPTDSIYDGDTFPAGIVNSFPVYNPQEYL